MGVLRAAWFALLNAVMLIVGIGLSAWSGMKVTILSQSLVVGIISCVFNGITFTVAIVLVGMAKEARHK
jgi:hypothetical protein